MAKYLIKTTEIYRTDTEAEAKELVEKAKKNRVYEVVKSTIENRVAKAKGEVIDEWKRVTITKVFDEEKEPTGTVMPEYKVPSAGDDEDE